MSYQNTLEVIECAARMKAVHVGRAIRLLEKQDALPESSFLDEMLKEAEQAVDEDRPDDLIEISRVDCWWNGHVDEDGLALIANMIVGKLSGYFVGEDGDLNGGFVIEDGKLTKMKIEVKLVPFEKEGG